MSGIPNVSPFLLESFIAIINTKLLSRKIANKIQAVQNRKQLNGNTETSPGHESFLV